MPAQRNTIADARSVEPAPLVAADASPLIGLAAVGRLDLLQALFGTIVVSRAVVDEVRAGDDRPGAAELANAMRAGWIRAAATPMATWTLSGLDPGEASTLALATEHSGRALVLMDDARGRERAAALDIEALDVAAILLAARRERLIDRIGPLLSRLSRKGFTLPEHRRRAALEAAGESGA